MANHDSDGNFQSETLPRIYAKAESQMNQLDNLSPEESRNAILSVVKQLETATKFVSVLGLFSRNEGADEIATANLRYLLLPAFLAKTILRLSDDRVERLRVAEIYITDFLRRCKDYEVPGSRSISEAMLKSSDNDETKTAPNASLVSRTPQEHLADASQKRAAKIAALKEKSESREKSLAMKKRIDDGTADEDIERGYYYNVINVWILDMLEDLSFLQEEKRILEHREKLVNGQAEPEVREVVSTPASRTFAKYGKPITIVKNDLQKRVFGAGYPSLPLLTVDEFYQELVEEGALPAPGSKAAANLNYMGPTQDQLEEDDVKKERASDKDDPEHLQNARDYDDWKDDHRRGFGNRIGQG